jgi:hypothetical protein
MLGVLTHAQLKAYLVAQHAIQKDCNNGRISIRQIARKADLSIQHTMQAMARLRTAVGLLSDSEHAARTTIYSNPFRWKHRAEACVPVGGQYVHLRVHKPLRSKARGPRLPIVDRSLQSRQRALLPGPQMCDHIPDRRIGRLAGRDKLLLAQLGQEIFPSAELVLQSRQNV